VGTARLNVTVNLLVAVAALLSVTLSEVVSTETTVVPATMPVVADAVAPTAIRLAAASDTVTEVEPRTESAEAMTVWAMVYVGVRVGDTVGALLGEADG